MTKQKEKQVIVFQQLKEQNHFKVSIGDQVLEEEALTQASKLSFASLEMAWTIGVAQGGAKGAEAPIPILEGAKPLDF